MSKTILALIASAFVVALAIHHAAEVAHEWTANYRYEHVIDGSGVTCYFDSWTPGVKCFEHETVVDMTYEKEA